MGNGQPLKVLCEANIVGVLHYHKIFWQQCLEQIRVESDFVGGQDSGRRPFKLFF